MNYKVVKRSLKEDFYSKGFINVNETKIEKQEDIVDIAKIFRDPRYETFRVFYLKSNKIVGQEAITSKIPNMVLVNKEKNKTISEEKIIYRMKNRMKRLDADSYYLMHNHPSGNAKASSEDINLTKFYAKKIEGLKAHIIINSGTYAVIEKDNNILRVQNETKIENYKEDEIDKLLSNEGILGLKIKSANDLVNIAYNLKHSNAYTTTIMTDSRGNIKIVLDIPNSFFNMQSKQLNGFFKNQLIKNGATRVFTATQNEKIWEKLNNYFKAGTLKDNIFYNSSENYKHLSVEDNLDFFNIGLSKRGIAEECERYEKGEKMNNNKSNNYKWINFLNNTCTVKVTNEEEFEEFKNFLGKVNMLGILRNEQNFEDWQSLAIINNKDENLFLFEYNNAKGLTWDCNEKESIEWFGNEPLSPKELNDEFEGNKENTRIENIENFVDEMAQYEDDIDHYEVEDIYGNINTDEDALNNLKQQIWNTLQENPLLIKDFIKTNMENIEEPQNELYKDSQKMMFKLNDLMFYKKFENNKTVIVDETRYLIKLKLSEDNSLKLEANAIDGEDKIDLTKQSEYKYKEPNQILINNSPKSKMIIEKLKEDSLLTINADKITVDFERAKEYDKEGLKIFLEHYMTDNNISSENVNVDENSEEV